MDKLQSWACVLQTEIKRHSLARLQAGGSSPCASSSCLREASVDQADLEGPQTGSGFSFPAGRDTACSQNTPCPRGHSPWVGAQDKRCHLSYPFDGGISCWGELVMGEGSEVTSAQRPAAFCPCSSQSPARRSQAPVIGSPSGEALRSAGPGLTGLKSILGRGLHPRDSKWSKGSSSPETE